MNTPCRYFRSKVMYVPAQAGHEDRESERQGAGFCWCNLSMTQVGEDDQLVDYEACTHPERKCYRIR